MNAGPGRQDRVFLYVLLSGISWLAWRLQPGAGPGGGPGLPSPGPPAPRKIEPREARNTDYPLKGVVKKVDLARSSLMIAHEAIPGFMAAMTMPFFYQDRALLESLSPGDDVEARSTSVQEDGVVVELRAARTGRHQAGAPADGRSMSPRAK